VSFYTLPTLHLFDINNKTSDWCVERASKLNRRYNLLSLVPFKLVLIVISNDFKDISKLTLAIEFWLIFVTWNLTKLQKLGLEGGISSNLTMHGGSSSRIAIQKYLVVEVVKASLKRFLWQIGSIAQLPQLY
jgi:hypothetical protein